MRVAYVDTSYFVAIAFAEGDADALAARLNSYDELVSANLLEAELRSTCKREKVDLTADFLSVLSWIVPNRPLSREIDRVLAAGYLRGADLWHLAAALFLAGDPSEISFLTLDESQGKVAARLGFATE